MKALCATLGSEPMCNLADPGLSTLGKVLDPLELGQHLNRVLNSDWGMLRDIQIQLLLHHPGSRCTIAIKLQTPSGQRDLIGKVYPVDRSDVYQAMTRISRSGFGPEDDFSIPKPVAFIPELHLLLQERVEGKSATEFLFKSVSSKRFEVAEKSAQWLAHFQLYAPKCGHTSIITLRLLERWFQRLIKKAAPLRDKAQLLLKRRL